MLLRRVSTCGVYLRRGKDFLSLWWLLVIPLCFSTAQGQYHFDHWTADNGLPQNSVYSILQTRDGYIWFTTLDGLVRFDGVKFTVFNKNNSKNLSSNRFTNLFAEADDTLWICTEESGLVRYRDGHFQTFTTADGLLSNIVHEVQKDVDGSLLIVAKEGLLRRRDGRFTVERREDFRDFKLYISPSGARWELDQSGLRVVKDGSVAEYDLPFAPRRIAADRTFNYLAYVRMLEDRDGSLWLAASAALYKMKDGAVTAYTVKDGMPQSSVKVITQDRQGDLWLGTEKDGACRFSANRFTCYNTANGLSSNHVMSIFADREGTLWVATNERGINRLTRQVVTPLSTAEGLLDKNVYPILEDSAGSIWLGMVSGLAQRKDGKVVNYARRDGLLYEIVQALHEDRDGRLWIGSIGGVEYLANGKFTDWTEQLGLRVGAVDCWEIHQDRAGALWFGTNVGLVKYQAGAATRYTTAAGLPSNDVKVIHEAGDGTLWLGTYGGLARFKDGRFVSFTEQEGLASNHVRAIYEDEQGTFWIGTYDGGLSRLRDGKFTNYTTDRGLYSNGVFQILEDARGHFWMSSNQGIYRVSRQQLDDFAAGKTATITSTVFGKSDGMLNMECNGGRQPAGIKARDGKLWFPTQDGVAIIDPEAVLFNPLPPPVVIESATLKGVSVPLLGGLRIEPGQDNLEIRYTGLSFIKPEQLRFRYQLEGLDKDWTEAGTRRTAYYPYLPPGRYTFKVTAANADGVWNLRGESLRIVVIPPFYRTWWFLTLAALGSGVAVWLAVRFRLAQLHERHAEQQAFSRRLLESQEEERKRIAAELHDSLGQQLLVIKNWAMIGLGVTTGDGRAREPLDEISATASQAIDEVREVIYDLRPYQLDKIGLANTIRFMIKKVATASGIEFQTEVGEIDELFPYEAQITLYRVVQECVNNIVKHSQATAARVAIERHDQTISVTVEDNGRGFALEAAPGEAQGGFGLTGLRERVRMLGGRQVIHSAPGSGTRIQITIDLNQTL